MGIAPVPTSESRQGDQALVHLRRHYSAPSEPQYPDLSGLTIPVHVAARQIENAIPHSQNEWDAVKPTIQRLYMEEHQPLKLVMQTMAEEHDFHATMRMYKTRFRRWGWRKYRTQDQQLTVLLSGQRAKGTKIQVQNLMAPELLNDQEVPILISRNYTIDQSGSQRWNCIVLNMSEPSEEESGMVRFCDAEIAYVSTIHQLKSGRIQDAFHSLNRLFDTMTGSKLYLHPKYLTGFWLLCHGIYNACAWVNDSNFHLLRELLAFHGRNAAACFQNSTSSPSSHPIVSLMRSIARISRDNPKVIKQTFRNAYLAAAESLEEKLGRHHPVVLITWTDYFWYFNFPVDPAMDLVARQQAALLEAEAASGREADVTICLLHNLAFFHYYCVGDDVEARKTVFDLLERTCHRITGQASPTISSFHVQRAHAFGTLLHGLFILEDFRDRSHCQEVIGTTIEWLKQCEGKDAFMHARMLEMDLLTLTKAWEEGENLRDLTLAFAKPRSADYDDRKPRRERQRSEGISSASDRS